MEVLGGHNPLSICNTAANPTNSSTIICFLFISIRLQNSTSPGGLGNSVGSQAIHSSINKELHSIKTPPRLPPEGTFLNHHKHYAGCCPRRYIHSCVAEPSFLLPYLKMNRADFWTGPKCSKLPLTDHLQPQNTVHTPTGLLLLSHPFQQNLASVHQLQF